MHEGRIEGRLPRPLIVRFGAMGDMVILTAAIRALHQRFGSAIDVACSGRWVRPLLEGQPGVGAVYTLYTRNLPYALNPRSGSSSADCAREESARSGSVRRTTCRIR